MCLIGLQRRVPLPRHRPQQHRVHERVAERLDRGHVGPSAPPVRLHQHGHLAVVAIAGVVGDPADVHERVHGLVGELGHPLVARLVDRVEDRRALGLRPPGDRVQVGTARSLEQVGGQPLAQRAHPAADAVSASSHPNSAPSFHRSAKSARKTAGNSASSCRPTMSSTSRGKSSGPPGVGSSPHVLELEVGGELVDRAMAWRCGLRLGASWCADATDAGAWDRRPAVSIACRPVGRHGGDAYTVVTMSGTPPEMFCLTE